MHRMYCKHHSYRFVSVRIFLCVIALLCLSQTFSASAEEQKPRLTYFVITQQARPFQMDGEPSDGQGVVSDLVAEVLSKADIVWKVEALPFRRMIRKMEQTRDGQWIALGSPAWSGIQSERLSATPVSYAHHVALVSKSVEDASFDIFQLSQFKSKNAVLLFGFDYPGLDRFLNQHQMTTQYAKSYDSAFRLVRRDHQHSIFIEMESRIDYNLKQLNTPKTQFYRIDMSSVIPDYSIHLAYSPGLDEDIVALLDAEILRLKASGQLRNIIARYQ
ncbi:hypothetical protein ACFOEK_09165 [Litoribrevibacter euphylliae]|uniref:Solute-binding protein family 3/N-terminal domain-containing protein n=1 Tax=Litoribrevibacter euphylliae TaxID=1834034 RepID=A0ABV7HHP2_9GAMM